MRGLAPLLSYCLTAGTHRACAEQTEVSDLEDAAHLPVCNGTKWCEFRRYLLLHLVFLNLEWRWSPYSGRQPLVQPLVHACRWVSYPFHLFVSTCSIIVFMSELVAAARDVHAVCAFAQTVQRLSVVNMQLAALFCLSVRILMLWYLNIILKSLKLYSFKVGELLGWKSGRFL